MAGNGALELTIRIAGKMDSSLAKVLNESSKQVSSFSQGLSSIAKTTLAVAGAATVAVAAGLDSCVDKSAVFADQMADVVKYVPGLADASGAISDAIAEETDNGKTYAENYDETAEAIKRLATQIPITKEGLTQLTAAAGQSGKTLNELFEYDENGNVQGFMRDTAMLAAAWDIDASLAGDYAAKWENIMLVRDEVTGEWKNMDHDAVMQLADQINYLGAHTATTAAEIAGVVNDVAGLGQVAGMDPASVAALADTVLALGVDSSQAATGIRRMFVNMSLGGGATAKQEAIWNSLGFTAEGIAASMQEDSSGTLLEVFRRIDELAPEKKMEAIKGLFNQYSAESVAKLAQNTDQLIEALEMVQDFDNYDGSMMREFIIKSTTPEALEMMEESAKDNLMVDIGDAFLPIRKELSSMKIDLFEGIRANLPDLAQLANSAMPLLRSGVEGIGTAIQKATPYIQKAIDYVVNNGDKVKDILLTIGAALGGMLAAPTLEGIVRGAIGLFSGGTGSLTGTGSKATGGIVGAVSNGAIGLLGQAGTMISGATYGSQMYGGLNGAIIGALTAKKRGSASSIPFVKSMLAADGGESGFDMIRHTGAGQYFTNIATKAGVLGNTKIGSSILGVAASLGGSAKGALQGIAGGAGALGSGIFGAIKSSAPAQAIGKAATALWTSRPVQTVAGIAGKATSLAGNAIGNVGSFAGSALNLGGAVVSPLLKGGLGIFTGLMGTFGPIIAGLGTVIALVSVFGDHLGDVRGVVEKVFGESGVKVFDSFVGKIQNVGTMIQQAVSPEGLLNIQEKIRSTFGDGAANLFGPAIPIIQSIASVFSQIVDLGVNHIKPLLLDVVSFVVEELWPAIGPVLGTVIDLVGTALTNAIKVVVDVLDTMLPVIEPIALGIVDLFGGIVSVVTDVVNGIIRALNKIQIDIPDWVPLIGGMHFGFDLSEIQTAVVNEATSTIPQYANGGFTRGMSIAGEDGMEAVISFKPGVRGQNIATWMQAGRMLGVDGGQAAQAAGIRNARYFANGGFAGGDELELKRLPDTGRQTPGGTGQGYYAGGRQYVFAPQIEIYGDSDPEKLRRQMDDEYERFKRFCDQYEREKGSTRYA